MVECGHLVLVNMYQKAVKSVKQYLAQQIRSLPRKAEAPFPPGYRQELDVSQELGAKNVSYYSVLDCGAWHVDICLEVSMMSGHLALPRGGHLQCLYHMFAHL